MNEAVSAVELDERANGTAVHLVVGQELQLRLEENPTTGFRWRPDALGEPCLSLLEDRFAAPSTPHPGRPGHRLLHLGAISRGVTAVRLTYSRRSGSGARMFELRVVVE